MNQPLACTIAEACRALGMGRNNLYSLIGDGSFPLGKSGAEPLSPSRILRRLLDALPEVARESRHNERYGS
jgi:hypothetical protein